MRSFENPFIEVFGVERRYLLGFSGYFGFQVAVHRRHTPPAPLERGVLRYFFLLVMRGLSGGVSPLERG